MEDLITGKVVKVIDEYKVVINKGINDGVKMGHRFLIYRLGDEIIDPDTNENLGRLEIVSGEAKPDHIQERFTTVITDKKKIKETKTVVKNMGLTLLYGGTTQETYDPEVIMVPFENVSTDCLFKQIP